MHCCAGYPHIIGISGGDGGVDHRGRGPFGIGQGRARRRHRRIVDRRDVDGAGDPRTGFSANAVAVGVGHRPGDGAGIFSIIIRWIVGRVFKRHRFQRIPIVGQRVGTRQGQRTAIKIPSAADSPSGCEGEYVPGGHSGGDLHCCAGYLRIVGVGDGDGGIDNCDRGPFGVAQNSACRKL